MRGKCEILESHLNGTILACQVAQPEPLSLSLSLMSPLHPSPFPSVISGQPSAMAWRLSPSLQPLLSHSHSYHQDSLTLLLSLSLNLSLFNSPWQLLQSPFFGQPVIIHDGPLDLEGTSHPIRSLAASPSQQRQHVCGGHGSPMSSVILRPFFTVILGANKFLSTSSSQWYPMFMIKVHKLLACFCVQKWQTLPIDLSQMKPYFEGQSGLRIRIRDHSQTFFGTSNAMAISNLTNELPLKITFFEVSLVVSICMKFQ